MKKGISMYISHVTGLAIALVAFGLIAGGMFTYYNSVSTESQESQARLVAQSISEKVVEMEGLYRDTDVQPSDSNITLGRAVISVPEKISGKSYDIELLPRGDFWITSNISIAGSDKEPIGEDRPYGRVRIKTQGPPAITSTYDMYNVLVAVEGEAGRTSEIELSYVRTDSGDKVVLSNA